MRTARLETVYALVSVTTIRWSSGGEEVPRFDVQEAGEEGTLPCGTYPMMYLMLPIRSLRGQTDRHLRKQYLPTTQSTGGNYGRGW